MSKQYTEAEAVSALMKAQGCRVTGTTIEVERGRLGINMLGVVDFLKGKGYTVIYKAPTVKSNKD